MRRSPAAALFLLMAGAVPALVPTARADTTAVSNDGVFKAQAVGVWKDESKAGARAPFNFLLMRKNPPAFIAVAPFGAYDPATDKMTQVIRSMGAEVVKTLGGTSVPVWNEVQKTMLEDRLPALWRMGIVQKGAIPLQIGAFRLEDKAFGLMAYGISFEEAEPIYKSFELTVGEGAVKITKAQSTRYDIVQHFSVAIPGTTERLASPDATLTVKGDNVRFEARQVKVSAPEDIKSFAQSEAQQWGAQWTTLGAVTPASASPVEAQGAIEGGVIYSFTLSNDVGLEVPFAVAGVYFDFRAYILRAQNMNGDQMRSVLGTLTDTKTHGPAKQKGVAGTYTPSFLKKAGPTAGTSAKAGFYTVLKSFKMLILIGVFVAFLVVLGIIVKITESGEPPPPQS